MICLLCNLQELSCGNSLFSFIDFIKLIVSGLDLYLQVLTGHQDNVEFALAMCPTEPFVLSGGWKILVAMLIFFVMSQQNSSGIHDLVLPSPNWGSIRMF